MYGKKIVMNKSNVFPANYAFLFQLYILTTLVCK